MKTLKESSLLSLIIVLLLSMSIDAAELDELLTLDMEALTDVEISTVYGVSKMDQRTIDTPAKITIISDDEIERRHYRTLVEALSAQSGFYTSW